MTVPQTSSLPRVIFRGIDDQSAVNLSMPVGSLPQRLPLFFIQSPWGEEDRVRYVDASAAQLLYGNEVIDPQTPYFSHQNVFMRTQFEGGGKALVLRLAAEDAKAATGRLAIDVLEGEVPLYERNTNGSLRLDASGNKIPTGETVPGHTVQFRWIPVGVDQDGESTFGTADPQDGTMVGAGGATSTLTPIQDALARHRGSKGNNLGIRFIAPTAESQEPADGDYEETLGSRVYRFQYVERSTATSSARTKRSLAGGTSVDFSFKKGAVDLAVGRNYFIESLFKSSFESKDESSFNGFAPLADLHVYQDLLQGLLEQFAAAEADFTGEELSDVNLFNFLTGVDINGNPYHTYIVQGPSVSQDAVNLGELSNLWLTGGSDGEVSPASYNTLVSNLLDGIDDHAVDFRSIARIPADSVWDTGFPMAIKKKFSIFNSIRPDIHIHACTQDVSQRLNTPEMDAAALVALRSHFRAQQESAEFGTGATRFTVVTEAGKFISDDYQGIVPFLEWWCLKGAQYMGAENGMMDPNARWGRGEQNIVARYVDHNAGMKKVEARNTDWNNGGNFTEFFDMEQLFYAGCQSIFANHSSILHAYFNVCIACNLTRLGHVVWRELSGDSQLDDQSFLDEVNRRMNERTTSGVYDGRVDVTPNAYYNAQDEQTGYSWHLDVTMEGENIRTVQNLAIIAQRRRNEEAA